MKKKKKIMHGAGMGYRPVSSLGHDTMELYRDIVGMGAQPSATIRPGLGHDMAEHAPQYGAQCARYGRQRACAGPGWG